ncbi:Murein DD-endopeptidase MepM and murein hydrolase activator NlpD, contain LysM domain [Sporobacter termitidis DSM 10068]|uniref:Murein DD-endopeptidase MepM and murein hydrolase activator NlpD, contain LysM domain n=1 Tax=Sporobacter termitidis DSM 10068 TaxID=1123282 RepID=A0A1M5ULZ8_9FIRM|nr:M23 family metallopeptidase [Sporobacter termitidis]SHH63937.1 Murein DD-endopeptidase MepM and murein hydrolase activator NlpD, contain LysM domain [Sporobacter termitidis DSM 10068]
MTRKWVIRIVAILMALIMAMSVLYVVVGSLTAAAVTQSQIDALKQQQKEYEKKKNEIQSEINSLQYQQKSALEQKGVLDNQIQLTQDEIDNINDQIAQYDQLISQKQGELEQAQANEDAQWAKYKLNLRTMEENGTISYISVIFRANSYSDLLARLDFVRGIMQYDIKIYDQLQAAKEAKIQAKSALEEAKAGQEADRLELTQKEADLEKQLDASTALLAKLAEDIDTAKDLYEKQKAEADKVQSDINKKVEELKKQNQGPGAVKGTGSFIWPTPSSTLVTSRYGTRVHPIYHEYRTHTGVDIGAKYGASIEASDSGTVIIAKYSSSYGNYVVIDHGNGYTTLYAHMSQILVKSGAKVQQGAVIGKVGATGDATGPHLHFEISQNGSRINPLQFFTNYTLSASA